MSTTSRNILIGLVVLIVILILGFFAWKERQASEANAPLSSATTTAALGAPTSSTAVTTVSVGNSGSVQAPSAAAPLTFGADTSADEQATMQAQFAQAQATIKTNPTDFNSWITLGTLRKETGDYVGAAADWQYMSDVYPTNIVSFANLGDLYTSFAPNYAKAVANYKQEIVNNSKDVSVYMDLYALYTGSYPQSKATIVALLQKGLAANPKDPQLTAALAAQQ